MSSGPEYAVAQPPPPPPGALPPPPVDRDGFPRWPLWLPFAAVACGLTFGLLVLAVVTGVLDAAGVDADADSPGLTAAGTLIIDVAVVVAAVMFAALVARPRGWHFGLRGAPLGFTTAIAVGGVLAFFLFELVYAAIVQPDAEQTVVEDLGADNSQLLLWAGALVVILVAPVCEELFFRGILYRVLRARMSFWIAAVIDGVLFGLVHGSLVIVPILGFLGVVLCYVYERTGTLYSVIAIHALNNMISYGVTTDDGWAASLAVGALALVACAIGIVRSQRWSPSPPVPVG
jgi:membrane protease YdiL (CAAX protease family)